MEKQPLLNTYVNNLDWEETFEAIDRMTERGQPAYIVEINTDVCIKIEKDSYLKEIAEKADLSLVDGKPLLWVAKWMKRPVKEKISGSDLTYALCERAARKNYSIFILGGGEGVAETAAGKIRKQFPGIRIAGVCSPEIGFERNPESLKRLNEQIREAMPDLLFVCLGCPKQEKWVYENYRQCGAKVSLCAGASVDFLAGKKKRAPGWVSSCGMEWFYRFLKEPKRLFRRYFIDDMKIFSLIWKYRRKQGREI